MPDKITSATEQRVQELLVESANLIQKAKEIQKRMDEISMEIAEQTAHWEMETAARARKK